MTIIEAIILAIVQGVTEFLPVSSSGHLVLFQNLFNIESSVSFDLMLHFGSLIAVGVVYFHKFMELLKPPYNNLMKLVIATVPVVIVILFFRDTIEGMFGGNYLPFAFLITAIVLLVGEIVGKRERKNLENGITNTVAITMGIAQCIAVIPGISRSGMTISAGLLTVKDREKVADFSFMMSAPIIFGSMIVMLMEGTTMTVGIAPSIMGIAVSAISSFFAIKFLKKVLVKSKLAWFSVYLLIISIVSFILIY